MKQKWMACVLLALVAVALSLPAQQGNAERTFFDEAKAKAEKGDANAQNELGVCYYKGQGVAQDKVEAVKWYGKAAEQGDAKAQFNLGLCYVKGDGVAEDHVEAVKWFAKAAQQNVPEAQYNLGICYAKGDGVTKDVNVAAEWFRKSAGQEYADAQCELGSLYLTGNGVKKDLTTAAMLYRKAAERGNPKAQYNLGHLYADGQGVAMNGAEAVSWYRKAAEQGYADAQFNLGVVYSTGNGVLQDYAEAVKWLRKAADQGVADAQYNLGNRYANGQGVREDLAEAIKWYRRAADQGVVAAQQNLRVLGQSTKNATNVPGESRNQEVGSTASKPEPDGQYDPEQRRLQEDVYYADAEARYWQQQLDSIKSGKEWQPVLRWDKDGNPIVGDKQTPTDDAAKRIQSAIDTCLQTKEQKQKQLQQLTKQRRDQSALPVAKKANRRPFTQEELQQLQARGYDTSGYHGEEVDIPEQPVANTSPTPDALKKAVVYMNAFLGIKDAMIVADVISMKTDTLRFRFRGQDFDYSGHYTVLLTTPREHKTPYFGFGSPEVAKRVVLEDFRGKALPLPNPTFVERSAGFINVLSGGKEWIYSGPYSVQK